MLSGFATGAPWLCCFRAIGLGNPAQVVARDKLGVVLVAVFGAAFPGGHLSGPDRLGVAAVAAAAILVACKGPAASGGGARGAPPPVRRQG
ncbi:hypothetical protein [Paracoccus salipaludis]|uniref:EamA domain-containing protein n=1 Tax=Paracoccus salipaludis TaxID=2032623 RepID=A0A2A2GH95_9RHOB|nr:hypothetical protein [Paracoccus salipaludis]PAU96269.1 hypothetical protein CK240_14760 [Paracoccus salipaludis]